MCIICISAHRCKSAVSGRYTAATTRHGHHAEPTIVTIVGTLTLDKQELLRHNAMAPAGQRFTAVMEVLVQELVQERISRSRVPSSVSVASLRDSKGRRRQVGHQQGAVTLDLPRTMGTVFSKSVGDLAATGTCTPSDLSAGTAPKGSSHESALTAARGGSSSELLPGGRGFGGSTTSEAVGESKERCKTRYVHVPGELHYCGSPRILTAVSQNIRQLD